MSAPDQNDPDAGSDRPNSIPWPPLIVLLVIFVGWLLGALQPSLAGFAMVGHYPLDQIQRWLGWLLIGLAIAMDLWVLLIFQRHNTNIRPDRPATTLVSSGPFAYSRNPVYVGNVAIVLGMAFIHGSIWYGLLAVLTFLLVQKLAIEREEKHLAIRFGDEWRHYAGKTRRWL